MSDLKVRPPNGAGWPVEAQDKRDELAATGFNGEDGALKGRRYKGGRSADGEVNSPLPNRQRGADVLRFLRVSK